MSFELFHERLPWQPKTKVALQFSLKLHICDKNIVFNIPMKNYRLGGLSLPRKSVVRLTDRPDMTLDVYRGRKTTVQQQQQQPMKN